jgi:hypothetical protein
LGGHAEKRFGSLLFTLPALVLDFSFKHPEVIDRLLERARSFGHFNPYKTLTCLVCTIVDCGATLLLRKITEEIA